MSSSPRYEHTILSLLEREGLLNKFSVIPLNGKKPIEKGWQRWCQEKRPTNNNGFFNADRSEKNVGVCCGPSSGVLVVDVDDRERFRSALKNHGWILPKTFAVETGGGGIHFYFVYPEDGRDYGNRSCKHDGFDVRGVGGQVVAPGSIHPESGKCYRIIRKHAFADAPEWLLHLYESEIPVDSAREDTEKLSTGKDDQTVIERVQQSGKFGKLFGGDWDGYPSQSEADLALCGELARLTRNDRERIDSIFQQSGLFRDKWNKPHSSNGRTYGELTIEKALQELISSAHPKGHFKCTDLGNAERLIHRHGQDIRFCYAMKRWFVWDETRWIMDPGGMIVQRAKDTVRHIYDEVKSCGEESLRKDVAQHAMRSESQHRISAMVRLAESESGIQISPEDFDKDPYLLNTQSGTVNLRTMKLLPHQKEHYITKIIPIELDPSKSLLEQDHCPEWRRVLIRIFGGNRGLITFFKRTIGYTLTGDTSEQCLFDLYGLGANGKTTLIEMIRTTLGEYALQTDFSTFVTGNKSAVRNDIARLRGARFVSAIETEAGEHLHESLVKQITGEDRISARFLYQEFFEFEPRFKVFLAANHKPVIKGTDHAIWRRIKLIPFNVTIPEEEQDHRLREKLKEELPGILSWALQGCLEWRLNGLGSPDEVRRATAAYREEMDPIGGFIADGCEILPGGRSSSQELYERYLGWCNLNGEEPITSVSFGRKLSERGLTRGRGHSGTRCWTGIRLKDREDNGPSPCPQSGGDVEGGSEPCNAEVSIEDLINGPDD